jgi:glycosyltransferase involved in cell wall biosynthesis
MKKILHIINSFDLGGNERFLVYLLERLDRKKFQQEVCVPDRGRDKTLYLKEVCDSQKIPIYVLPTKGNFDRTLKRRLCEVIGKGKYDIVHTHLVLSQYYGRKAAIKMGVPCIISSEQNTYEHKARFPFSFIERRLAKKTNLIIACSESVKDHLIDKVRIPPTRIRVIYNSVDTSIFKPSSNRDEIRKAIFAKFRIPEGSFLAGVVAHLSRQKGHDDLLRAMPVVLKAVPNFHLLLAGDGVLHDSLVLLAEELGVMKHVTFAGIQNDVAGILNALDLFMLPSRWEGFGIAAIEAMACRVPVIVSYVGGLREIVADCENGLIISHAYPEGIAKAIIRMATEKDLRDRLAAKGLLTVHEKFDVGVMVEKVAKAYQTCSSSD